jgi:hypothetical protein
MQVGGEHYASEYQHWDLMIDLYSPSYLIGYATKYLVRYKKKGNPKLDLEKAIHVIEKLSSLYASSGKFEHRLPRHPPALEMFSLFAKANNLDGDMVRIFHLLLGYTSVPEIELAKSLTEKLLRELK